MRFEDVVSKVRLSVAQICIEQNGKMIPIGTGFLVGSGRYLVTAKHVVDSVPDRAMLRAGLAGVDHVSKEIVIRATFARIPMSVIAEDSHNDLALLEVDMPPGAVSMEFKLRDETSGKVYTSGNTGPVQFSTRLVVEGLEIAVSGFPLLAPSMVTTRGIVASTFAPAQPDVEDSPVSYICDVTAISGNSGGPVYRVADGSVIGVCIAVKLANVGTGTYSVPLSVVTPIEHVVALMESAGVDPGKTAGVVPPPKKVR